MVEVCIIGAGISGLVSAKVSLDYKLIPCILEKSCSLGGIWKSFPEEIGVWNSILMNTSKPVTMLSDHPWPRSVPEYPSQSDTLAYFESYAKKHDLEKYINFGCEVRKVQQQDDSYRVTFIQNGQVIEKVFKYVICASGFYSRPADCFEGKEEFRGLVIHSSYYRQPAIFEGKKVLVVGRAFSAGDIAAEASLTAISVTQVYRNKYFALRRKVGGMPSDFMMFNVCNYSHADPLVSSPEGNYHFFKLMEQLVGNPGEVTEEWHISDSEARSTFINFSVQIDNYYSAVTSGRIKCLKGEMVKFYESGIILQNGDKIEADVIILATGFFTNFDYLDQDIQNIIGYDSKTRKGAGNLYRASLHPALPGLAFVGSFHGFFTAQYEIQSEVALKWFTNGLNAGLEELWGGVRLEERSRVELKDANFVYDLSGALKDYLRILGISIDVQMLQELGYQNGPFCSVFFWKDRPGQLELIHQFVQEMKDTYPEHNFNEVLNFS